MERLLLMVMLVSAPWLMGCGDKDDGGSTTAAICTETCARALECAVDPMGETQESCTEFCVGQAGGLVCDDVNEGNLSLCLSAIDSLSCEALAAGQAPAVCNAVCLVRVKAFEHSIVLDGFE